MAKFGHFYIQPDTPTPRRRSACLGVGEPKFSKFSSPPRRTSLPRHSEASLRRICKLCFLSSLSLILTISIGLMRILKSE